MPNNKKSRYIAKVTETHLEFLGSLVVEGLQGEAEVVVVGQLPQVEVILGVNAGRHVDVELEELQEVALHLIPVGAERRPSVTFPSILTGNRRSSIVGWMNSRSVRKDQRRDWWEMIVPRLLTGQTVPLTIAVLQVLIQESCVKQQQQRSKVINLRC